MHLLLLRIKKNPNVTHKTLSLKVTSDETVMANTWQTSVLRNQFLTKGGIKLQLTESIGSPISLGKPHQHSCGHKRTLTICLALPFQYPSHSAGISDTIYCLHSTVFGKQVMSFSSLTNYIMKSMFFSTTVGPFNPVISQQLKSQTQWAPALAIVTTAFLVSQHRQFPCKLRKHRLT
jgi:hypothetical protein